MLRGDSRSALTPGKYHSEHSGVREILPRLDFLTVRSARLFRADMTMSRSVVKTV